LNQWGITKNIPGSAKQAAVVALGKRARDNNSTPAVFYNDNNTEGDRVIDKKRLRRHIATTEKKKEAADITLQLSNNV